MTTSSGAFSLDNPLQTMDVLAGYLDAFIEAWEAGDEPPRLGEFLPPSGEIRRLTLVELVKVDLEYRWLHRNLPKRLVDYVAEFPELAVERIPSDLIYEEFHIRKQSGADVAAREYLEAFPTQAAEIAAILGIDQSYVSSSFFNNSKRKRLDGIDPGTPIDDFDLLAELGAGAFAKVFLARQRSMQRLVALKITTDQSLEPQTLAQLDHDHIVRVYDLRIVEDRKLRLLYMQYVAGGTLQAVVTKVRATPFEQRTGRILLDVVDESLERRGESRPVDSSLREKIASMTWPEAVCWIGAKLAEALDYAHRLGVLHRDVKPANVLLTPDGFPKLADFNISFSSKVAGATPAAYFGGSLAYMSPEQLEACNPAHERSADSLDGRTDLYSLGVLLWELLTGFRPFKDEQVSGGWSATLEKMAERRRGGVSASQLEGFPDCPPGLPPILERSLQPSADARWPNGRTMARRLELCIDPQVEQLLFPPADSWRARLQQYMVLIVFVTAGLPNVLAGAFNYVHNVSEIMQKLGGLEAAFQRTMAVVNGAGYPIGAFVFWYLGYSVFRTFKKIKAGVSVPLDELRAMRRRCLRLGHLVAVTSIIEWSIAAYAYPTSLRLVGSDMPGHAMFHFLFSLTLCGFIAAVYPFFGVTFYCLRFIYPTFLMHDLETAIEDKPVLEQFGGWTWRYLLIAALVPLLAIVSLLVTQFIDPKILHSDGRLTMVVASAVSFLGLPVLFWLLRRVQTDAEMLLSVVDAERRKRG